MDSTLQHKKTPYLMIAILFVGAFVSFLNNSLLNVALAINNDRFRNYRLLNGTMACLQAICL